MMLYNLTKTCFYLYVVYCVKQNIYLYVIGAQACVLAFSTVDRESFEAVESWKKKVTLFVYQDEVDYDKAGHSSCALFDPGLVNL